jgi:hypothetical protein
MSKFKVGDKIKLEDLRGESCHGIITMVDKSDYIYDIYLTEKGSLYTKGYKYPIKVIDGECE